MKRASLLGMMIYALIACLRAESQQVPSPHRALLDRYCVTCHNEKLNTAGLVLNQMDVDDAPVAAPVWEKVIRKLRARSMPPAGLPRPDESSYESLAGHLETALDRAASATPNPGRTAAVHRLNRSEYVNVIRDLLALDIDGVTLLPADDSSFGFDNNGDVLGVSPALLERYMSAAEIVSRLATGDTTIRPALETYEIPERFTQFDRASEDLPFGSRGGLSIRHYFPLDGTYTIKIDLKTIDDGLNAGEVVGFAEPRQIDLRLDGSSLKVFTVGGENATPARDLRIRVPVKAGRRTVGVTFLKEAKKPEGSARESRDLSGVSAVTIGGPYEVTGPGETASRRRIFVCSPASRKDETPCAGRILATLSRRAYRRPVGDSDLKPLLGLYEVGRKNGDFEAGIRMAVEGILVSPGFLFRVEPDRRGLPPGSSFPLSDLELASRLSFFLWSSMPDDELLGLAERGQLQDPAILDAQVARMMRDARFDSLINNFSGQWLQLRDLEDKGPDREVFPGFDENLRQALLRETELFFGGILRDNRGVGDLLTAKDTYLNERLARHYGIPNIFGSQFRRVELKEDARRGLLGKGSILTVTSYNSRTSPVLRGKWILENILGTPPPPPPPNVPSLKDDKEQKNLTMRQRMEEHRKNPACASCHKVMDPLGFALENFDAIGQWRTTAGADKTPIDVSGALPDGTPFQGVSGLQEQLRRNPEQFARTFTEKMMTYALGRGVEYFDAPAIRKILHEASPDYRSWSLITGIVKSTPFLTRRSKDAK
ncbi:MAG: DUF1592 domain-containing protein [Acidobacteria bacterium]|nr:DUF1592 domain-containing protein [Acidobacteriota bacterium]